MSELNNNPDHALSKLRHQTLIADIFTNAYVAPSYVAFTEGVKAGSALLVATGVICLAEVIGFSILSTDGHDTLDDYPTLFY